MNDVLDVFKKLGVSVENKGANVETKANEVMHTSNTAAGKEFLPLETFRQEIMDILPQRSRLLPLLPGNHGVNLPKKYTSAVLGLSVGDLEFEGKSEWTTGTASQTEDDHSQSKAVTKQVSIEQASFILEIDVSDNQLRYNAANTEQYIRERIAQAMAYTVDALIVNGDSEAGATGNVNLDDSTPGSGKYYLKIDGGIRERAINGSYTKDFGTLAAADFSDLLSVIGEYATAPEDCLFMTSASVRHKIVTLDEFETVDKYGDRATALAGLMPTPYGVDIAWHRAVPKTEADGKVSNTGSNNTKGQVLLVYKPAVQFGFGQEFNLEVVRVPGYGFRMVATFDFGFKIIDAADSLTEPTVAAGINITL